LIYFFSSQQNLNNVSNPRMRIYSEMPRRFTVIRRVKNLFYQTRQNARPRTAPRSKTERISTTDSFLLTFVSVFWRLKNDRANNFMRANRDRREHFLASADNALIVVAGRSGGCGAYDHPARSAAKHRTIWEEG